MFLSSILTGLELGLKILGKSCRFMLNSAELRTQPCFTPIEEEKYQILSYLFSYKI